MSIVFGSPEAKAISVQDRELRARELLALEDTDELKDRLASAEFWKAEAKREMDEMEAEAERIRAVLKMKGVTP